MTEELKEKDLRNCYPQRLQIGEENGFLEWKRGERTVSTRRIAVSLPSGYRMLDREEKRKKPRDKQPHSPLPYLRLSYPLSNLHSSIESNTTIQGEPSLFFDSFHVFLELLRSVISPLPHSLNMETGNHHEISRIQTIHKRSTQLPS